LVVVGGGWALEMLPLVVVVADETFCVMVMVMVIVIGMAMICIRMILDPG